MVKLNDVIKELEGIKVTVKGNEIDLTGMTYLEFMVMSEELNDKELHPNEIEAINFVNDNLQNCFKKDGSLFPEITKDNYVISYYHLQKRLDCHALSGLQLT